MTFVATLGIDAYKLTLRFANVLHYWRFLALVSGAKEAAAVQKMRFDALVRRTVQLIPQVLVTEAPAQADVHGESPCASLEYTCIMCAFAVDRNPAEE